MKIKQLQQELRKKRISFAVFSNFDMKLDPTLVYFANYLGAGFLVVPKDKKPFLIASNIDISYSKGTGIKAYSWKDKPAFEIIKRHVGVTRLIGIDEKAVSVYLQKQLRRKFKARFSDISETCLDLREIKTKAEIRLYRKACKLTDRIVQKCLNNFKRFKTEEDVSVFLKKEVLDNGVGLSFEPIIASGPNASYSHKAPKGKLKKGFCVIDFGINYKGYCTDITRTIYLGKPSKKEKEIYEAVLNAQLSSIKILKPGMQAKEVYDCAVNSLGTLSKYFTHGLGHGIGVEIHEKPNLSLKSKGIIKKNSIFTIEPGVYVKNKFGIRIEDDILMLDKPIVLTKTTKKLICIR